jgi:hypothetical protein
VLEDPSNVVTELYNVLNAAAVLIGIGSYGLSNFFSQLAAFTPPDENPDPAIWVGGGKPDEPGATQHAGLRRSELLPLIGPDGPGLALLDQMWVIYAFEAWEQEYRPRLAISKGIEKSSVTHPYFGDLRLLRQDAVHRAGRASRQNTGRCDLLAGWFADDELIRFSPEQWALLLGDLFPRDALLNEAVSDGGASS